MLINKSKAKLYGQANQLAKEAQQIADELFKGAFDRHRIAVLAKGYAELYADLGRQNDRFNK